MSKKRSINLLSSSISSKFQAQSSPSLSTPMRRDSGESYRSTSDSNIDNDKTDWRLCFLCQKQTSEKLQCSALSKTDPKQLYDELADRIKEFHSIKILPILLNIVKLEDGLDLGQSLFSSTCEKYARMKVPCKYQQTVKELSKNQNYVIMRKDKRRGMVIMNKSKCHEKYIMILENGNFKTLDHDLTKKTEEKVQ